MNKTGNLGYDLYSLNKQYLEVGRVKETYALNESNWEHHRQISNINSGLIVITEPFNCGEKAIFGDLVAKYLGLYCPTDIKFSGFDITIN
jgi:4-hydroxy-4-methyl-2-oxoglutarate aldolase